VVRVRLWEKETGWEERAKAKVFGTEFIGGLGWTRERENVTIISSSR